MELLLDKLKLTKTNKDFLNQMNQLRLSPRERALFPRVQRPSSFG